MSGENDHQARPNAKLRPILESDRAAVEIMLADRPLQNLLLAYPPERGVADAHRWLERRRPGGEFECMAIASIETDEFLGFVQASQIHQRGRFGWLGMALLPEARGTGLGRWALRAWIDVAVEMDLRKFLLEVRADNEAAISLYRSEHFRDVGELRDHYHDGERFYDVRIMERLIKDRGH